MIRILYILGMIYFSGIALRLILFWILFVVIYALSLFKNPDHISWQGAGNAIMEFARHSFEVFFHSLSWPAQVVRSFYHKVN